MNKRIKKKLALRGNRFHYSDWKQWKQIYDCAVKLYGKDTVDAFYSENAEYARTGTYLRNITVNITNKHGNTVKVKLFRDCFPYAFYSENNITDNIELVNPTIVTRLDVDQIPVEDVDVEEALNAWHNYIYGVEENTDES